MHSQFSRVTRTQMIFIAFKMEPTNTKTAITPNTAAVRRAEARRMAKVVLAVVSATQLMSDVAVCQHPRFNFGRGLKAVVRRW